jgi:acyl-coenzyme A thioesterase PaaI-like protein
MQMKAFQDYYPASLSHCFGCGRLNEHGLHIKSYWDGEESVCVFQPRSYHTGGIPGYVYGGLIAALIDCHANGTAAAAAYRAEERKMDTQPPLRFVTASLRIDYLRPTPIDSNLELRGNVKEIKGRKTVVTVELSARGQVCARGEVVTVQMPPEMMPQES